MKRLLTYIPLLLALLAPAALSAREAVSAQCSGVEYVNVDLYDTICEGTATYTRNGFNLRTDTLAARAADHVFSRVSSGNDTVYRLWLAVLTSYHTYDTVSICQNALPMRYGSRLFPTTTPTGDYGVSFLSANGCDSIVSLRLTVDTMLLRDTIVITCHSFTWDRTRRTYNTVGYSQPDNYMLMGHNGGCDTLLRLGLLIYDTVRTYLDSAVCDSFTFNGNTYTAADTLVRFAGVSATHGCDSVVYYQFTLRHSTHGDFYVEAYDDVYVWSEAVGGSGATFYISGLTNRVTRGSNGCDSTTTLHLLLLGMPVWCTNEEFENNQYMGFSIATPHVPGTYGLYESRILTASDGVSDSMAVLRYRFKQSLVDSSMADTICSNALVDFHGATLSHPGETGGFFRDTVSFQTTEGCDSLYIARLHVLPAYIDTVVEYHCRIAADWRRGDSTAFFADTLRTDSLLTWRKACDSVVYRNQFILVPDTVVYHREACVSYVWEVSDTKGFEASVTHTNNGTTVRYFVPDSNNTDTFRLQNMGGCDSTVSLSLILKPQTVVDTVIETCYNFAWPRLDTVYGVGLYPSVIDTFSRANRYRCDSILRMDIRVYDTSIVSFDSSVCEQYTYGGATYRVGGERRGILGRSSHGCDSVGYITFILYHNIDTHLYYKVYDSLYRWTSGTDSTYRTSATDTVSYVIGGGCDSTATMHLRLEPMPIWCSNVYLPDSLYYTFKVENYTAGLHRLAVADTINVSGAPDTVALLSYRILQAYVKNDTSGICADDTMYYHGRAIYDPDNTGVRHDTVFYTAVNGCDSLFVLRLTIANTFSDTVRSTICRGKYHIFTERFEYCNGLPWGWSSRGGSWRAATTSDVEHGNYWPADGDSAAFLNGIGGGATTFLVSPPIDLRYSDTADISFWYINPKVNDSLNMVCLYWTETPNVASSWRSLWCEQSNVTTWSRTVLHLRGSLYKKIIYLGFMSQDHGGCSGFDSIAVFGYNNAPHDTVYITTDTLHSVKGGCDSVVTRIVKVIGPSSSIEYREACSEYAWSVYHPDGTLAFSHDYSNTTDTHMHLAPAYGNTDTAYLLNYGGCDSLVMLDLLLRGHTEGPRDSIIRCNPYVWRVQQLDGKWETAGTFYDYDTLATYAIRNIEGCDSILTLDYRFMTHIDSTREVVSCDSYTFKNITYTATTTAYDTLLRDVADGCDTVVAVMMQINYTTYGDDTNEACESFMWIDGRNYTASTNRAYHTIVNEAGCDSIVRLVLTIRRHPLFVVDTVVCDRFVYDGLTYDSTGNYVLIFPTGQICDSLVDIRLTVNFSTVDTDAVLSCGSYNWNGFLCDSAGFYSQLFSDRHGCDSLVWLDLTLADEYTDSIIARSCYNYEWYGRVYTASGRYTRQIPSSIAGDCDSVRTLILEVDSIYSRRIDTAACDSLLWQGNTYTSSVTNSWRYTSISGCDSIVTLAAVINRTITTHNNVGSCSQYIWNGQLYTENGYYEQLLQSAMTGCDSIATIDLTIYPTAHSEYDTFMCDYYIWDGQTYGRTGHFTRYFSTIHGCDSVVELDLVLGHTTNTSFYDTAWQGFYVWNDITYTSTGDYVQYFEGRGGCDSTVTLHLTVYNGINGAAVKGSLTLYPNPTSGEVRIKGSEAISVDVLDLVGRCVSRYEHTNRINLSNMPAGVYALRVTTRDGVTLLRVVKE